MSNLTHHPLGKPVPDSVHAVCVSLPTMRDVMGYEEKRPETLAEVKFAYPRFVFHDYVLQAAAQGAKKHGLAGRAVYAVSSEQSAREMAVWMKLPEFAIVPEGDFVLIHFPDTPAACDAAKAFLQHTGTSISSRQSEAYLREEGLLDKVQPETRQSTGAQETVLTSLREYLPTPSLHLCSSGMNAFYAALKAARKVQAPRGRKLYLQLGWLYLDTMKILEKFLGPDEDVIVQTDVFDGAAIEKIFAEHGDRLAGVVTELPTNPLVHTLDVDRLGELCEKHGVIRIYDPSLAGLVNVDLLPHTDMLVTSLTKYAAHEGDVMSGALALNPESPFYDELSACAAAECETPYVGDVARLAVQIGDMSSVAAQVNANALALAEHLSRSPAVAKLFTPLEGKSAANFRRIARSETAVGAILTFDLSGSLADFYDHARVVKGPSFGTSYTMMCPFLYLAHYDLVSTPEGRSHLQARGLNPELIRLSVGTEPVGEIIESLGL
ncbi:MAG: PLP-dependent transferase [Puniceicoccales bacterium]